MAALRCMIEKVGRTTTGFYNHQGGGVRRTKLVGLFGAVINNYYYQHYSSLPTHSSGCMELAEQVRRGEGLDLLLRDFSHGRALPGKIQPYPGSMDDPAVTRPALFAVEQHNKQQNTNLEFVRVVTMNLQLVDEMENYITLEAIDNGVKNTYQAKVWLSVEQWELQLFRLAPDNQTSLTDNQDSRLFDGKQKLV